jgi:Zn-dependent peptidase ImmA (M78 family)
MQLLTQNDAHSQGRQASDIAHELAHALLEHPPGSAIDPTGCRVWNQDLEEEASWLAAALLISEESALAVAWAGKPIKVAAQEYGVTEQLMKFRLNVTAARERVNRARRSR